MFALQLVLLLLVTVAVFSLQHSRQVQRQESLESLTEALTVLTQRYQQAQQALAQSGGACHQVGYGRTKGNSARVSPHSGGNSCSKLNSGNGSWHKYQRWKQWIGIGSWQRSPPPGRAI
ncbi:MAG: hypothetical protein G5702_00915 [Serratia symbiotica]|nr:hypothetical protein [Serratia symbiotica]